jgi:hypothetical protein
LRADAVGDVITLNVDGAAVLSLSSADIATGAPGTACYGSSIRGGVDDWSAGTWEGVQTRYRIYDDTASPSPLAAQNTQATVTFDQNFVARVQLDSDGDILNARPYQIEYSDDAGSSWHKVESGSGKVRLSASPHISASAVDTTAAVLTTPGSTFTAGRISDDTNPLPALSLTASQYSEYAWCLRVPTGQAAANDEFLLRITDAVAGAPIPLYGYTQTASIRMADAWARRRTKVWNGSAWVERAAKRYDGTDWRQAGVRAVTV